MESRILTRAYPNHKHSWETLSLKESASNSALGEDSALNCSSSSCEVKKNPASVDIETFSSQDSEFLAQMYCLAYTNCWQEINEDPEYNILVNSCQVDGLTSMMHKPLKAEFWTDKKTSKLICTQIEQNIRKLKQLKRSADRKSPIFTYLERISSIFAVVAQKEALGTIVPESKPVSQDIYSLLQLVSRVGESKPVYYTKLDMNYETRDFKIIWDGSRTFLTSQRSSKLFLDQKVQDLVKKVENEIDEFRDFLYFDPTTRYEIPLKTRLRDLETNQLVASEIVTNLAPEDEPLTIKFTFDRDHKVFFLLSFAHGKWYPSVAKQARRKISELLGVAEKLNFTIRYCKNEQSSKYYMSEQTPEQAMSSTKSRPNLGKRAVTVSQPRVKPITKPEKTATKQESTSPSIFRDFDEAVDLFGLIFQNHKNAEWPMFTEVFFDLPQEDLKSIQPKQHKSHQLQSKLSPADILGELYTSKCKKLVSPTLPAQILILEHGQSSGIQASDLATDFRSVHLDPCTYVYYQLRAVVIEVFEEKCGSLFVPVVKVDGKEGGQWYSPVHDSYLACLTGLNMKSFIYERTFDSS